MVCAFYFIPRFFMRIKCLKSIKETIKSWQLGSYFRQFSIVVAGVIVTFGSNRVATQLAQQKEINAAMQLIAHELQVNQEELRSIKSEINDNVRISLLLREKELNLDLIPADTIQKYQSFFSSTSEMIVTADALEVLKSSSLMQHIADKQMLQELLWTYNKLYEIQSGVKSYYDLKYGIITKSFNKMSKEEAFTYGIKFDGDAHRHFLLQQPDFIFFIASTETFTDWGKMDKLDNKLSELIAFLYKTYGK